ncbi:NAD-dependent epimerase/dehydratase family protein [Mesorhizobium sp. SARCC-RB16n]|uniref:NAD-dependent epimerase/dehydratase family protein n=1 Tax=Mesorhizobium sp. SARCC-RB16n TaxID=2116687 RepID=UPI0035900C6C
MGFRGCGFIGSHLIDRLLRRDDLETLVVVDNLWTGLRDNIAHVSDPRFSLRIGDAESFAASGHFDEIIHLASGRTPSLTRQRPLGLGVKHALPNANRVRRCLYS